MRTPLVGRLAVVALLFGRLVAAAGTAQPVDVSTLGPQVGQKALEFRLTDQNGQWQTLKSVAGSKGTMLVFFRSADW
jgi:cytochrome oxidase Cu insertion factor (SCO1/SenC/PrrC family)